MVKRAPDQGDIVYMDFNPQIGHEQAGRRPGLVVSPTSFNRVTGFIVVCPITRTVRNYPYEVPLPSDLMTEGVVLAHQVKSLDWKARKAEVREKVPQEIIDDVLDLIHTFL
ncbi:type II toxin-antitoxin system PemK/MazF family toxin [Paenibacillus larvae]|uniref:mRNA interferase NdoA n=3 Tax=Paenibacillus larvae TaxID=1464 RepID=A0A6C0QX46_9BACL|nr:type II toxin-antitoxin system PemK/MazF family toxin [Paenibacillus larvae]AVF22959.1 mRNA interferase NdoA [Paenibacillus larvae subsp. larvae]ETK26382.1 PpGpp-regulated growth inhibitor (ChpA/MazF) [Paenibacillus larvae subsp. larvae DSM 25719]MDE5128581.1 type II toxin-antitoxin system PemK/MazF family toxin [Paenibacillus larvae subsp. larvae]MDE5136335.1 type II toxin-antitoxin system PemK/MazF family toxin [Paenibacillus larvae subsp. larvae]MDE5140313.1 type II toxin-antitoxin syste